MAPHSRAGSGPGRLGGDQGRRPDASMTLLREIFERPHGPDYIPPPPRATGRSVKRRVFHEIIVLVLTIAIGMGGVWAARQLRAPVDGAIAARAVLEEQINERSAVTEQLRGDIKDLRAEISELEAHASSPADRRRAQGAQLAAMHAGTLAVTGPGIEVELVEVDKPTSPDERVLDVDLQVLVNGLWAAGAEAVTINGRRLAYGTAIRTAGEVILVDLEPVQSPYSVKAIGDPDRLVRNLAKTSAADHLRTLQSTYRISSNITQHTEIEMPAGNSLRLNYAESLADPFGRGTLGEGGKAS